MESSLETLDGISPISLANLMMAVPLRRRANLIVLQPHESRYGLFVKRGSLTLAAFGISTDVGNATVARLARIAEVDPLARNSSGTENTGRFKVRVGHETGEFFLSVGVSPEGLDAELRPVLVNGNALEQPAQGQLKRCLRCAAFQAPQRITCEFDGGDLIDILDDARPGGTIGAYRLGKNLGDGGMGTVIAAEHALIGRPVAIKLPHCSLADNPMMARRFLAEARAASRLHHPNIVDVTDFGLMSDGRPYMVMERLAGVSLRARLDRLGAIPPLPALLMAREVTIALQAAHDGGVVHRDLKPDNIILLDTSRDDAPRLKLVDFGAACLKGENLDEEFLFGTPCYMSPEHSRGDLTDGRTDIYALGIVIFEMLSGKVPFDGETNSAVRIAHMVEPVPPPMSPTDVLPDVVSRIVTRALRKQADERYQTAGEMLTDIDKAIAATSRRDWRRWLPI